MINEIIENYRWRCRATGNFFQMTGEVDHCILFLVLKYVYAYI